MKEYHDDDVRDIKSAIYAVAIIMAFIALLLLCFGATDDGEVLYDDSKDHVLPPSEGPVRPRNMQP